MGDFALERLWREDGKEFRSRTLRVKCKRHHCIYALQKAGAVSALCERPVNV